jgi:hypothetical protein
LCAGCRTTLHFTDNARDTNLTTRRAGIAFAIVWLAALALGACSGGAGGLRPETPAGIDLAGTWKLNRAASDDPQAMLEEMRRMRGPRVYLPPVTGEELPEIDEHGNERQPRRLPPIDSGGERGAAERRERFGRFAPGSSYTRALGAALTAEFLKIEQSPTRFVLIRGEDRRSFTPGGESVVSVANGVADQHSGWSGREYVIEVKPQVGPRVIERYALSADGHQLVERFTLTEEGLPKLEFTRVYEPGTPPQRALPTSN